MPIKLAKAANNAPIPNQSSTNPDVKISATMSIAPRMHQITQNHSLIVEITGRGDTIARLLDVLKPNGVLEMVRTGRVAMARGPRPAERLEDRFAGEDAHEEAGVSYSV